MRFVIWKSINEIVQLCNCTEHHQIHKGRRGKQPAGRIRHGTERQPKEKKIEFNVHYKNTKHQHKDQESHRENIKREVIKDKDDMRRTISGRGVEECRKNMCLKRIHEKGGKRGNVRKEGDRQHRGRRKNDTRFNVGPEHSRIHCKIQQHS